MSWSESAIQNTRSRFYRHLKFFAKCPRAPTHSFWSFRREPLLRRMHRIPVWWIKNARIHHGEIVQRFALYLTCRDKGIFGRHQRPSVSCQIRLLSALTDEGSRLDFRIVASVFVADLVLKRG